MSFSGGLLRPVRRVGAQHVAPLVLCGPFDCKERFQFLEGDVVMQEPNGAVQKQDVKPVAIEDVDPQRDQYLTTIDVGSDEYVDILNRDGRAAKYLTLGDVVIQLNNRWLRITSKRTPG